MLGRRRRWSWVAAVLAAAGSIVAMPGPATAMCHIASFTETDHSVDEDAGRVRLTVYLVGERPACAGSVHYETENGTARAPRDYRAREGELTFTVGDDRRESFTIPIVDDGTDEGRERFTVRLSRGERPGNIQPSSERATVTIVDDDEPEPAEQTPSETPAPAETESPSSPSPSSPSPSSPSPTLRASPVGGGGGSGAGAAAAIAAAIAALAGAGYWIWRRRAA